MLSEKPWRPEAVLLFLLRLFASLFLGLVLTGWLSSTDWLGPGQMKLVNLIISTLSFHGVALVLVQSLLFQHETSWAEAFGFVTPRLTRTLALAVLVGVAVLPVALWLGELSARVMHWFQMKPVVQGPIQMLQTTASFQMKFLIGLLAILLAPCAEELVFRGVIYPVVKQHGFPRLALWGTSVFFAVVHQNIMILLPLTFLAVVLTLLYETTNNLLAPIVAHSVFNLVNFVWVTN